MKREYDTLDMVTLAWEDFVALQVDMKDSPSLQSVPAFREELSDAHRLYVSMFQKWERGQ
jgi:hypothetical protein